MKQYERGFMHKNIITAMCIVVLLSAKIEPATANTAMAVEKPTQHGNIIFILDASGSMWGQIEGRAKIDIAKEVLSDLVRDLPEDINAGLVAYGHRRKGDCNDVQELVILKKIDKPAFFSQIQAINPKGKTPMIRSVRLTAEKLKGIEEETTIILISDGKETCDDDPCAKVGELRAAGIRFVMHVIGFNVTKEEKEQLECMAKAGGGRYFTADNAGDLLSAAREIVKESQNFGYLKITALLNNQPIAALMQVLSLDGKTLVTTAYSDIQPDLPGLRLAPGVYSLVITDKETASGSSVTIDNVKIEIGKTFEQTVNFSSGTLELKALKDGKPLEALFSINIHGEKQLIQNGYLPTDKPALFKLPAGKYDILLKDKTVLSSPEMLVQGVEIKNGQTTNKTIEFIQEGTLELTAVKGGNPFDALFYIYTHGEKRLVKNGYLPTDKPGVFKLLAGKYDIVLTDKSVLNKSEKAVTEIEVKSLQTTQKTVEFPLEGTLEIMAIKGGQPFEALFYIYPQGAKTYIKSGYLPMNKPGVYKLLPGSYDLKAIDKTDKSKKELNGVAVQSGQTQRAKIEF